jgi:hypothetical protein
MTFQRAINLKVRHWCSDALIGPLVSRLFAEALGFILRVFVVNYCAKKNMDIRILGRVF